MPESSFDLQGPASRLRRRLADPKINRSMGAHDVLSALLMEEGGLELVFLGGFGTTASLLGLPDLSFLGLSEMADAIRRTTARVQVPVIADADTGYGDLHQVARCVNEFERAGAAGLILEDQVFPKRCGHFDEQSVIPAEEMVLKLRTAANSKTDEDFLLVARTDARSVYGIDEAMRRIETYLDAGADIAFIEAPRSIEEIETVAKRIQAPKLINMLSFGKTPILKAEELEQLGFDIVVAPIETLLVAVQAIRETIRTFRDTGSSEGSYERMVSFDEIRKILGVDEQLQTGRASSDD
ncbi:MAG: isocitrate lyase/PEP mutase family protein [Planctomycetota bacterium]